MMKNNQGLLIEDRMRRFFKGKKSVYDAVDFETSTTFYEVKSCKLFLRCGNGNYKRKFKNNPHKKIRTWMHGRFFIKSHNHFALKKIAEENNKRFKYIFVLVIGSQVVWRTVECERLQGFSDGWTGGVSDTQRYKCLGNAVTVNVIEAIMRLLL